MGNILNSNQVYRRKNSQSKHSSCGPGRSGKSKRDCRKSKELIGIRDEELTMRTRMSSKSSMQEKDEKSHHGLSFEGNRSKIDNSPEVDQGGTAEDVTTPRQYKHSNTVDSCYSNHPSAANSSQNGATDSHRVVDANIRVDHALKVANQNHNPQNISPIDHKNPPPSFSTLWLPFKSPFRRPFFFVGNKAEGINSNHAFGEMMEGQENNMPMALAGSSEQNREAYTSMEREQQMPWLQPRSIDSQPRELDPTVITGCLDQDDVAVPPRVHTTCTNRSNAIDSSRRTCIKNESGTIGDVIQNSCCGIVPPIFQNATRHDPCKEKFVDTSIPTAVSNSRSRNESVGNDSKKQGVIPVKLSRRCKSDSSSVRHQKEQRQQDHQRLNHKKQRGAHQASSPPSNSSLARRSSSNRMDSRGRDSSPPPTVRYINDRRVTIIDEELKIFVVDLLTPATCELVRRMTDNHVKQVQESGCNIPTWRTLYTYTKRDLPCSEVKGLTSHVTDHIMASIIDIVGKIHGNEEGASKLHPRSWKEPHLLLYQKFENEQPHTGVEMHYDGCDITWNCMLSKSSEYDGGGTYIRALKKTVRLEQGQILVHPGELYHKGCDITGGERALIVCFMDGFDPQIVDPSSAQEDNIIYERNVRMY